MNLREAREILVNHVLADRAMRDYNDITEYEKFCENKCLAIETVLNELEKERCQCPQK